MNVYTSAANVINTTCASAANVINTTCASSSCVDLSCIPDEALSRAIKEVPDYQPIQFVKRDDYSKILATRMQVMEEIANRKLRREVNTTRFYDKSFLENLKYQTPYHPITKWPNVIPSSNSGASQPEASIKEETTLVERILNFFDKFSIKFATKVSSEEKIERVVEPSEDSNASDVCKKG